MVKSCDYGAFRCAPGNHILPWFFRAFASSRLLRWPTRHHGRLPAAVSVVRANPFASRNCMVCGSREESLEAQDAWSCIACPPFDETIMLASCC